MFRYSIIIGLYFHFYGDWWPIGNVIVNGRTRFKYASLFPFHRPVMISEASGWTTTFTASASHKTVCTMIPSSDPDDRAYNLLRTTCCHSVKIILDIVCGRIGVGWKYILRGLIMDFFPIIHIILLKYFKVFGGDTITSRLSPSSLKQNKRKLICIVCYFIQS